MNTPNTCPTPERLRGLLSGEMAENEQVDLTRHLEACAACQKALDTWLSSPSVEGLAAGRDPASQEAALRDLMAQVKKKSVSEETQAERPASFSGSRKGEDDLDFLQPGDRPDVLGKLGHYQVLEVLGKGGFGTVFRAFDQKLHRMVAIKVLAPELAASGTACKRFIREAQAAAAVKDDHVVAIYNVEDEQRPPYLVMELIDGITLQGRLAQKGPLELKEILRIGMQTAEGLAAAHKQGLVHRDIKPANILLENGVQRVKITDFGLAKVADDASVTQSGVIAGTPMFMSPEQAEGVALDHRSDLFSLGSVLYVIASGRAPFRAGSSMAVLKRVCEDTPRPIQEINPDMPAWLGTSSPACTRRSRKIASRRRRRRRSSWARNSPSCKRPAAFTIPRRRIPGWPGLRLGEAPANPQRAPRRRPGLQRLRPGHPRGVGASRWLPFSLSSPGASAWRCTCPATPMMRPKKSRSW